MAEQVPRIATASTPTTCCCEHVRNTSAAHITYMKYPPHSIHESPHNRSIQVDLGKEEQTLAELGLPSTKDFSGQLVVVHLKH